MQKLCRGQKVNLGLPSSAESTIATLDLGLDEQRKRGKKKTGLGKRESEMRGVRHVEVVFRDVDDESETERERDRVRVREREFVVC